MAAIPCCRGSVLAAALVALVACRDSTYRLDGPIAALGVYGAVTDSTGAPVSGAVVTAAGTPGPECIAQGTQDQDTTDAAGSYRLSVLFFSDRDWVGCARVVVTPPPGSAFLPRTVDTTGVRFLVAPTPAESVQVNIVLHAGA